LNRDRRDRRDTITTVRRKRFEIRPNTRAATWIETRDAQQDGRCSVAVIVVIAHNSVLRAHIWGTLFNWLVLLFAFLREPRSTPNGRAGLRCGAKRKVPAAPSSERAGTCECTRVSSASARKNLMRGGPASTAKPAIITERVRGRESLRRRD